MRNIPSLMIRFTGLLSRRITFGPWAYLGCSYRAQYNESEAGCWASSDCLYH